MLMANEPASPTGWARIRNIDEPAPTMSSMPEGRPAAAAGKRGGLLLFSYNELLQIFVKAHESIGCHLARVVAMSWLMMYLHASRAIAAYPFL
jgi:hypothetical protein